MDNLARIAPVIILLVAAGIVVVVDFVGRGQRERVGLMTLIALLGLAVALVDTGVLIAGDVRGSAFQDTVTLDDFTLFFYVFFIGVTAFTIIAANDYADRLRGRMGEFTALTLAIAAGAMLMVGANDLITLYVAIELTSISQYALVGFTRDSRSSEAGLKYLLLGATSSAVLLYGFALLFGLTGTTSLSDIGHLLGTAQGDERIGFIAAAVAVAAGFGFKMAVVPFQMWVPDAYEGAPTPVAAYLSVASKAAGFAVLLRVFYTALGDELISRDWVSLLAVLAAVSMTLGNVLAIRQTSIKRLLGYSSIAQAGTILIGVAATHATGKEFTLAASGVLFYLVAYALTNLGAFFAVVAITDRINSDQIADFAGIARRAPWLAVALGFCLVSLTGLPPTVGFIAKVYIFNAAVEADLIWLAIVGTLNTAVSAYYYLRVAYLMFFAEAPAEVPLRPAPVIGASVALAALAVLVFGIVPAPLIDLAERAADVFRVA